MDSTTITPETEFDTEQSHAYNQERFKELPLIADDSYSERGEKKQCPLKKAPAIRKRGARRKRNAPKLEATNRQKNGSTESRVSLKIATKFTRQLQHHVTLLH